jgi:solute carrier family 35 protein E1
MPTNNSTSTHKLDKLNLLFYSSGLAFILMIPLWLYSDFGRLWVHWTDGPAQTGQHAHSVLYYFFMNGTVHWAQNIIAFAILSSTSPVTYSIASLIKRIVVIVIAIIWFRQAIHPIQGVGITMTFAGLWMYNNAKGDVEKGENKMRRVEAARDLALPTSLQHVATPPPEKAPVAAPYGHQHTTPQAHPSAVRNRSQSIHRHPMAAPPPHAPPHHAIPPIKPRINISSPIVESYPSPPPSFDSPPPSHAQSPLDAHGAALLARRVPGHSSTPEPLLTQTAVTVQ